MLDKVLYPFPVPAEIPSFFATTLIPFIKATISSDEALSEKSSRSIYFPFGITSA